MPERRTGRSNVDRLRALPKSEDLVLEGDLAPTGMYVLEDGQNLEAWAAMWVEADTGLVRSTAVVDPEDLKDGGASAIVDAFVEACDRPMGGRAASELPAIVRVMDGELWIGIRDTLGSLGVRVELVPDLPALEDARNALRSYLGSDPDAPPPEPFSWAIDPDVLRPLFAAAASFARRRPWGLLDDDPPIGVALGKAGPNARAGTLYGCVLGAADMVKGIAFYDTRAGFRRALDSGEDLMISDATVDDLIEELRAQGAPVDKIPDALLHEAVAEALGDIEATAPRDIPLEDSMVVFYDLQDDVDPTYVDWIRARDLPIASHFLVPRFLRVRASGKVCNLTEREARSLTLAMEAVNGFLKAFLRHARGKSDDVLEEMETTITVGQGKDRQRVAVFWPGD